MIVPDKCCGFDQIRKPEAQLGPTEFRFSRVPYAFSARVPGIV
jgi:hypothetical protein